MRGLNIEPEPAEPVAQLVFPRAGARGSPFANSDIT